MTGRNMAHLAVEAGLGMFSLAVVICLLLSVYAITVGDFRTFWLNDNPSLPVQFDPPPLPPVGGKAVVEPEFEFLVSKEQEIVKNAGLEEELEFVGQTQCDPVADSRGCQAEDEPLLGNKENETQDAHQPESPPEKQDPFEVDEEAAKLIKEAVQRIDDELAFDHDIQTSLKVRKIRVDRSAELRKKRFAKRRQRGPNEPITIYFKDGWGFWGHLGLDDPKFVEGCSVSCRATVDKSHLNTSEVVLMMEPSKSYKHMVRKEANNKRGVTAVVVLDPFFRAGWEPYLRSIDLLISFSRHSDIVTTYAYGSQLNENVNSSTLASELLQRGVLLAGGEDALPRNWDDKIRDTAMFVSNCGSRWRTGYIQEIMKLTNVSSYGACFHTPGLDGGKREDKVSIVSKHKVFLSFENTLMEDYMTEKFFEAALVPAVTIYFGPTNANVYFPSPDPRNSSIINGWDYRDPRDMARLIRRLTSDFDFWKSHLLWKATPEASRGEPSAISEEYRKLHDNNFVVTGPTSWICRTCQYYAENYDFEGWEGDSQESTIVDDGEDEATYGISP